MVLTDGRPTISDPRSVLLTVEEVIDVEVVHVGTLAVVVPITPEAQTWFDLYVEDGMRWGCFGRVVEPRYLPDLLDGLRQDGFSIRV
jgi:hypothetical protein